MSRQAALSGASLYINPLGIDHTKAAKNMNPTILVAFTAILFVSTMADQFDLDSTED